MTETQEQRVADAVLQAPIEVKVGATTYKVAPPTLATLIRVSEIVSRLPRLPEVENGDLITSALSYASECGSLGLLAATLILGAREAKAPAVSEPPSSLFSRVLRLVRRERTPKSTRGEVLAREILETMSPVELQAVVAGVLKQMEIANFFALTTFLNAVNLLRPTKVENETTASGRSSEE
jgi:hypothetical protein|nr:MAG TPA: hypothetical protein [Caudoviricetes sp.]